MRFDPEFIERVRQAHNIVDLIANYSVLKRSGSQHMGLCPFPNHREKTPSFSVSEDKQIYHCFGCGKGGNIYTFLQEYQGMSFPEAIEHLAQKASIPLPQNNFNKDNSKFLESKQEIIKLNDFAAKAYKSELKKLPADSNPKRYLQARGINSDIVEELGICWAPDSWNFLTNKFIESKTEPRLAEQAGLIRPKDNHFYDYFRNRLLFPIYNSSNEVLGFGGRTLGNDNPKYLNSPDTPAFTKGRVLYGLNWSSKYIRVENQIIVVEGYMDFLALYQAGIKNVVAVLGTALTPDHCKLIARTTQNVVILFDGDEAGIRAAERSLPILLAANLLPKCCFLPNKLDPDDFIKKYGAEELKKKISQSEEMFVALLTLWMKGYGGKSYDKIQLIQKVSPLFSALDNPSLRELYLKEIEFRLQVDRNWLLNALGKERVLGPTNTPGQKPVVIEKNSSSVGTTIAIGRLPKAEIDLLSLVLKDKTHFEKLKNSDVLPEASSEFRQIWELITKHMAEYPQDFNNLAGILSSRVNSPSIVTKNLNSALLIGNAKMEQKLFEDCISWIRHQKYKEKSQNLMLKMRATTSNDDLEQFMNINKKRHGILDT